MIWLELELEFFLPLFLLFILLCSLNHIILAETDNWCSVLVDNYGMTDTSLFR